jgi:hypothetical protein
MDLRFTGHVHDTLESAAALARAQSRHNLWERNALFYIPSSYNNSYKNFTHIVDAEIGVTGIWGPVRTSDFVPQGPEPLAHAKKDWGIGE